MTAVGFFAGLASPSEISLDNGGLVGVQFEAYFSPRVSVRGQISRAWMDTHGHSFSGTVSPVAFNGNLVYNFEGGAVHPYVTAGIGGYHYAFTESSITSSDSKIGVNLGAGAEYFLTRRDTVFGELLVHAVPGRVESALATYDSQYWTLVGGYKKYFGR
jgi:hypothetical protein